MLFPIKPLDHEVTVPHDHEVGRSHRSARVLVRWTGVPIGKLEVPVVDGRVRAADVGSLALRQLSDAFGRELVRRALAAGRPGEVPGLERFWNPPEEPVAEGLPTVSVIVCTRDRPDDMARCLASLARLKHPPLEIIVVDNAPATDATRQLVAGYPEVRYVREDTPGLDHARNRGIRESRGEVLAYTDDDVEVDPGWTLALARTFAGDPSVGLVTGLVEPAEQETEAQVLFEDYGGFGRGWTRTYLQSPRGVAMSWELIGAGQLGAGANMAMRRKRLEDTGWFDPALDVGTPTLGGGDHEMFFRFLKSGWICLYEPEALVRHRHRRSFEELERLLFSYGHATRCYFDRETLNFPEDEPAIRKLRRWWWRHWAWQRWLRAFWAKGWFPRRLVEAEVRGYLAARGAYERARRQIVADEFERPDRFLGRLDGRGEIGSVGVTQVEVSQPLEDLIEGEDWRELDVAVCLHGRPLGRIRVKSLGRPVPAERLADRIAGDFWFNILDLAGEPALSWAEFHADLGRRLVPEGGGGGQRLDDRVPVGIVVPTCGRVSDLRRCLDSIRALETTRPVKVLVVDNRPGSGTREALEGDFPEVEWVEEPRRGSSYARNAGLALAPGEILVMTDDDMVVAPDWLEKLLVPFARQDVVAVTGCVLPGRLETEAERDFETYGGFHRGPERREFGHAWFRRWRWRAVPTWQLGGTGNLAIRAEFLEREGGGYFMECLGAGVPAGVGEDTLFFYRVMMEGGSVIYEPSAVAWHYHRASKDGLRRQLFSYARGHVAYHLVTWLKFGDWRGLTRLIYELPVSFAGRALDRLRGRSDYPMSLLGLEVLGSLAGPLALFQSWRRMKRSGVGHRRWNYYGDQKSGEVSA